MSDFEVRPNHEVLMRGRKHMWLGLYQLYILTPEQLCRLHYSPNSIKLVYRLLRQLAKAKLVRVGGLPVEYATPDKVWHSTRYYYTLTQTGLQYLNELGMDVTKVWKSNKSPVNRWQIMHALEENDVIISAALLHRANPALELADFKHDRVWKREPIRVQARNGEHMSIAPDAALYFRKQGSNGRFTVLLEHDRDNEEEVAFKRKIRKYMELIATRQFVDALHVERLNVAFTTFSDEQRVQQMMDWTREVLEDGRVESEVAAVFRFAYLPKPPFGTAWLEPRWRSLLDDPPQPLLAA